MDRPTPTDLGLLQGAMQLLKASPPTWHSAVLSNIIIFLLGMPIIVPGLSLSGIGAAFLLGVLTWRAFGPSGFLLVATYFVIVSSKSNLFPPFYKFAPFVSVVLGTVDGF
nr:protein VTE6, chloroplastic [Ipomoea batatas]GMD90252.1 protein VTE6, chloroplastic [Ipomoea batatas]GME09116.1 protein VTE6, chloroplastic [Ipomoea batatas]